MKELQICLENCDVIKVPWESVVNLSIYKVHKTLLLAIGIVWLKRVILCMF